MSAPRTAGILAALALAAHGLALASDAKTVEAKNDLVKGASARRIAATIHGDARASRGGVILLPGSGEARAHMDGLARELARNGLLAVAIDLGGRGDSEDSPRTEESDCEDIRTA